MDTLTGMPGRGTQGEKQTRDRLPSGRHRLRQTPRSEKSGGVLWLVKGEPVSGFEPLTVRLQGGCSARLSYTGRLTPVPEDTEYLSGYRFRRGLRYGLET